MAVLRSTRLLYSSCIAIAFIAPLLAVLQYHWISRLAEAEYQQTRFALQMATTQFGRDLDWILSGLYARFQVPADQIPQAISALRSEPFGCIVENAGILDVRAKRFGRWSGAQWQIEDVPQRLRRILDQGFASRPFDGRSLWLAVPSPARRVVDREPTRLPLTPAAYIVVLLDPACLKNVVLPALYDRHFAAFSGRPPQLIIRNVLDGKVFHSIGQHSGTVLAAEATADAGRIQADPISRAVSLQHSGTVGNVMIVTPLAASEWRVEAGYGGGGVAALVGDMKRRNLAIGVAAMLALAASFILVAVASYRVHEAGILRMRFATAISHDLRSPLAAIRAAAENLADGIVVEPGAVRDYGHAIREQTARLNHMVEQALAFSKAGYTIRAQLRKVEMRPLIFRAVETLRDCASTHGVQIDCGCEGEPVYVMGDESMLESAVRNLLSNAIIHGRSGGWVQVCLRPNASMVDLVVSDRGPGLGEGDADGTFEPSQRPETGGGGTGLGLRIAHATAKQHGGALLYRRKRGLTTFTLRLPSASGLRA